MREAPEAVVAAVQEAHDAHYVIGWDSEAGLTCNCGATIADGAWAKHAYEAFADAAWAAAYPAALRDAADRLDEATEADVEATGEATIAQVVTTGIGVILRCWADESEA